MVSLRVCDQHGQREPGACSSSRIQERGVLLVQSSPPKLGCATLTNRHIQRQADAVDGFHPSGISARREPEHR